MKTDIQPFTYDADTGLYYATWEDCLLTSANLALDDRQHLVADVRATLPTGTLLNHKRLKLLDPWACQEFAKECDDRPEAQVKMRQYITLFADWLKPHAKAMPKTKTKIIALPKPTPPAGEEWREQLQLNKPGGYPKEVSSNIALILENHEAWKDQFWFDVVKDAPMVGAQEVTDTFVTELMIWLGKNEGMPSRTQGLTRNCILVECQKSRRDTLQEWLASLDPWDGIPRVDTWLQVAGNAPDTPTNRFISRISIFSLIHRALTPGSMYRYVVILEGPEDIGKSKMIRLLGGKWAKSLPSKLDNKEAYMQLKGVWLAEFAELEALGKADEARIKAFISDVVDHYVPKYANNPTDQERRTVFMGTINEQEYLKGTTGNTRFFPIVITPPVNADYISEYREQFFAEAMERIQHPDNATWWEIPDEIKHDLAEMREERRITNPYTDHLATWLSAQGITEEITWARLAEDYLALSKDKWTHTPTMQKLGEAMRALGWESKLIRPRRTAKEKVYRAWVSQKHRCHPLHLSCPTCAKADKVLRTGTGHSCLWCASQWFCHSCEAP